MIDIAVIGMACHLPGSDDYNEYWLNLLQGVNSVTEIPEDRWSWRRYYGDPEEGSSKTSCKWGGFIRNADKFDASFFGISPREAEQMDPQQRLILQLAWQCIEDAGYLPKNLSGSDMGVFVGVSTFDYKELQERYAPSIEGHSATGIHNTIIPNRISYFFNFYGPSIAVDSACASSLVCVHQAVNAIRAGECGAALVGGVSLLATPTTFIRFQKAGMLSPTGACRAFDESADGYVRGEGGGLVFLKPLQQALADNDRILAVIKGTAVNHGGRTRSITAPSALSQSKVIAAALENAGVSPATISYVEAHGTGTPLGDPIEIHGLTRAFKQVSKREKRRLPVQYCAIGAVKTNIGHLEAGAGIAGLIKLILAMQHRTLPPNANFTKLNPRITLDDTPFYILDACRDWKPLIDQNGKEIPRRAGISSFGFGGVNAHVIVEQAPEPVSATHASMPDSGPVLLTLSANSENSLRRLVDAYVKLLKRHPDRFADICYDANTTRTQMSCRTAFVAESAGGMAELLQMYLDKGEAGATNNPPRIGFLFTGQGSQYAGMARKLYETQPVFRQALLECDELLEPYLDRSLLDLLFHAHQSVLNRTQYTQPVLFALEYALTVLLRSHGIRPEVVMGHSVGELVAACISGVYSLRDGLHIIAKRGHLIDGLQSRGGMVAVFASAADTEAFLARQKLPLEIAAVNAPSTTVISGEATIVETAIKRLAEAGIEYRKLEVSQAFHSALMEPMQDEFARELRTVAWAKPEIPLVSNVSGDIAGEEVSGVQYWVDHVRKPVLFQKGVESMSRLGVNVWLEIGPAPVLTGLGKRCIGNAGTWLCCLKPDMPDNHNFLELLASLFKLGVDLNFRGLWERSEYPRLSLPLYPFDGQRYWFARETEVSSVPWINRLLSLHEDPLLGRRMSMAGGNTDYFVSALSPGELNYLADHRVHGEAVLPASAYLAMALSAVQHMKAGSDTAGYEISDTTFYRPLLLNHAVTLQTLIRKEPGNAGYGFEIWSQRQEGESASDWILHAAGRVTGGNSPATTTVEFAGTVPAGDEGGNFNDPSELYRKMHAKGLQYGPHFQGLSSIDLQADHCVAEVRLPAGIDHAQAFWLHPAVLDAVFQAVSPLLPEEAFAEGLLPLPVAVERLEIFERIPQRLKVHARFERSGAGIYHCSYRLSSVAGKPVAVISGLKLKPIAPNFSRSTVENTAGLTGDLFYQPVWHRTAMELPGKPGTDEKTLVIYPAGARNIAEALGRRLRNVLLVCIGNTQGMSKGTLPINPSDVTAFSELVGANRDVRAIYFMGGFQSPGDSADEALLDATLKEGVHCLFHLIKALYEHGIVERGLDLSVITNRSFPVYTDDEVIPWGAAVHGLANVFCNENPGINLATIDLGYAGIHEDNDSIAGQLVGEHPLPDGKTVAYRNGYRHIRRIEPVMIEETQSTAFREKGVYLILGGAGGIGLTLSRHLAERYQARLVWVGRSPLDESKRQLIAEMRQTGGDAVYIQADGCDVDAMRSAVQTAVDRFGNLNGAIHSALVLRDQALANMNAEMFEEGMAPKVHATWALYEAVKAQKLDFLIFFSSVNSFYANKGQANYVAGCVFKDSFALYLRHRHQVPVKIINWGYWGDVGAVANEEYRKRLEAQGIHPLDSRTGIEAIERALVSPATQLIAVKANADTLRNAGFDLSWRMRFAQQGVCLNAGQWCAAPAPVIDLPAALPVFARACAELDRFAVDLLAKAFSDLEPADIRIDVDPGTSNLPGAERYRRFYAAAFEILRRSDMNDIERLNVTSKTDRRSVTDRLSVNWQSLESSKDQLLREYPWLTEEMTLLWQCGRNLAPLLKGEMSANSIIFPDLSMSLLEGVYGDTPLSKYFNRQLADSVCKAAREVLMGHDGAELRILEIGAGTGCLSRVILEYLAAQFDMTRIAYAYTDVLPAFLDMARDALAGQYPSVQFGVLDIEKEVRPQGFEPGSFDIVIASNVFCVVSDVNLALRNAKALLKTGGALIFNELVKERNFVTLTFGLLDDWWSYTDQHARIPDTPLLTVEMWRAALREEGFDNVWALNMPDGIADVADRCVIAAVSDGCIRQRDSGLRSGPVASGVGHAQSPSRVGVDDVLSLLGRADSQETQETLLAYFSGELAEVLRLDAGQLAAGRSLPQMLLSELGMDSLTAMDLRGRLKKKLNVDVPAEILLGGSSIQVVIDRIYDQLLLVKLMGDQPHGSQTVTGRESEEEVEILVI